MTSLWEYVTSPPVQRAVVGVGLIGVNAALSGVFANFRSLTFLVSGASHAALAGAALAIVLQAYGLARVFSPVVGAMVFAVALGLLAAHVTLRQSARSADPAVGVGFAFAMALAVALISLVPQAASRVWGILLGDILLLTTEDLWLLAGGTVAVGIGFWLMWDQLLFVTFDIEGAKAFGINAGACSYILFALVGVSTAIIMKGVGAIVVFAMLVSPGAAAMVVAPTVRATVAWAFGIAAGSGLVAIVASFYTGLSVSALAALLAAGSYFGLRLIGRPGSR